MASDAQPLAGLGVLVTRPAHQAEALCRAIERAGGHAQRLPLLAIDGPADEAATTARLRSGCDDGIWIFTSPNAVAWAARLSPPDSTPPWPATLAAAGRGTARALSALGCESIEVPSQDGAAGLLQLPVLQDIADRRLSLICGERPLSLLAEGLRTRGAEPSIVEVYRRRPLAYSPLQITQALSAVTAAIVSSGESLHQLYALTPSSERARLLDLQLAVPSTRVLELVRQLGFRRPPLLPERVGDDCFTQVLIRWRLARV